MAEPSAIQVSPDRSRQAVTDRLANPSVNHRQAVTGVMPPQLGEALIREAWPTVAGLSPALASLGKSLTRTFILAPLGFLLLLPLFALKFAPFICRRYTLTNRRLMIQRGLKPAPAEQVALADIEDIRFDPKAVDPFFISGTLEILSKGRVVLTLPGVPEPEGFRQTILNARSAWVPSAHAAAPASPTA